VRKTSSPLSRRLRLLSMRDNRRDLSSSRAVSSVKVKSRGTTYISSAPRYFKYGIRTHDGSVDLHDQHLPRLVMIENFKSDGLTATGSPRCRPRSMTAMTTSLDNVLHVPTNLHTTYQLSTDSQNEDESSRVISSW
jgi:hypothetical protein